MQQILEYSFARILVRVLGLYLVIQGLTSSMSLISWIVYYLSDASTASPMSLGQAFRSLLPTIALVAFYVGLGIYLVRDAHPLARVLVAGMHGRCRRCGYDVRAITAAACPECGAALPRHHDDPPAPVRERAVDARD